MAAGDLTAVLYSEMGIRNLDSAASDQPLVTSAGGLSTLEPVADVTDFVVAVGDLISIKNGIVIKCEHAS